MTVTLRRLTLDDTAAVHAWASLPESCRYQEWGPNTYEQTEAFMREAVAAGPDRMVFAIVVDGAVVGNAELKLRGVTTAEIGYGVHPRTWGRGIGTAAARELLRIGFGEYARHRIYAT